MPTRMIIALTVSVVVIGWAFWLVSPKTGPGAETAAPAVASIVDGTQIIDIRAKGGYTPRVIVAKEGIPTTLRVTTSGTFDCSASLVIPKLSYQKSLQPTGTEDIALSAEQAEGTLQGLCGMGMYSFQIKFQ